MRSGPAKGNGSIINVVTTAAFSVVTHQVAYGSTKAGLVMLTRYLAKECAPEVHVNALCPGTTSTDGVMIDAVEGVMPFVPMQRVGRSSEMVGAALFLASDASSCTTGQTTFVDAGRVGTLGGQAPLSRVAEPGQDQWKRE